LRLAAAVPVRGNIAASVAVLTHCSARPLFAKRDDPSSAPIFGASASTSARGSSSSAGGATSGGPSGSGGGGKEAERDSPSAPSRVDSGPAEEPEERAKKGVRVSRAVTRVAVCRRALTRTGCRSRSALTVCHSCVLRPAS
jgi:hypothetical protein